MGVSNRYLLFNDMACSSQPGVSTACGVVLDRHTARRVRVLPKPVLSLSQDGRQALTVSLQRLEVARPGEEGVCWLVISRVIAISTDG